MSRPCSLWAAIAIGILAATFSLGVVYYLGSGALKDIRHQLVASSSTSAMQHDLIVKFGETVVGRADQTVTTAQIILGILFAVAGLLGVRQYLDMRSARADFKEELEKIAAMREEAKCTLHSTITEGTRKMEGLGNAASASLQEMSKARSDWDEFVKSQTTGALVHLKDRGTMLAIAEISVMMGQLPAGVRLLESIAEGDTREGKPDLMLLNRLASLQDSRLQYESAQRWASLAIETDPDNSAGHFHLGIAEIHLGMKCETDVKKRHAYLTDAIQAFENVRRIEREFQGRVDRVLRRVDWAKTWLFAGEAAAFLSDVDPDSARKWQLRAVKWTGVSMQILGDLKTAGQPDQREIEDWLRGAEARLGIFESRWGADLVQKALDSTSLAGPDNDISLAVSQGVEERDPG